MMSSEFDYSDYEKEKPADKLEQLTKYVDQLSESNLLVSQLENQLDEARKEQRRVSDELILPLMDELKLEEFKTQYGFYVAARDEIRSSITVENQPKAHEWLRETGNGGLIKNEVKVSFGKHQDNVAKSLTAELQEKGYEVVNKEAVHPSTLNAFVKEKVTNGFEIDPSISVFRQRILVTEEKTKKKGKK